MVRPTSYFIYLSFKCQSAADVLVEPLAVAGRVLGNKVCSSVHPIVCWVVLSEFWHGTRKPDQVVCARFFGKTFCPLKLGKWAKKRPKIAFLNLKKKFAINFG